MNNCFTCELARDKGDAFACGFDPAKLVKAFLASMPFYPVVRASAGRMPVKKEKVPKKACPCWKPRKGTPP